MVRRVQLMRTPAQVARVRGYIRTQWAGVQSVAAAVASDVGGAMTAIIAQVEGVHAGYTAAATGTGGTLPHLSLEDILLLNYDADAFDIVAAADAGVADFVHPPSNPTPPTPGTMPWLTAVRHARCTAAVVAAEVDGQVRLWAGHTTWADYVELLRVYKVYTFAATAAAVARAHTGGIVRVAMSSFPGMVSSTDDWFLLSSGLLVMETTSSAVVHAALAPIAPPRGAPMWLRAQAANAVATTGAEWAAAFLQGASGTGNSMWMVVAARAVAEARAGGRLGTRANLPAGTLTVVETSAVHSWVGDVTPQLAATGVWWSVNRPRDDTIRTDLGYPSEGGGNGDGGGKLASRHLARFAQQQAALQPPVAPLRLDRHDLEGLHIVSRGRTGEGIALPPSSARAAGLPRFAAGDAIVPPALYSHTASPRARSLAREAARGRSTTDMAAMMAHNRWRDDGESLGRPYFAVAARYDLAAGSDTARAATGGMDTKVAEVADAAALTSYTRLGPSSRGADLPPWDWRTWTAPDVCRPPATPCGGGASLDATTMCGAHGPAPPHGAAPLVLPCEWDSEWAVIRPG